MEQVSVAIKKHRHKSFEGPEMVKKKNSSCVASAPCQRGVVRGPSTTNTQKQADHVVRDPDSLIQKQADQL